MVSPVSTKSGYTAFCIAVKEKEINSMFIRGYGVGSADTLDELNWFAIGY